MMMRLVLLLMILLPAHSQDELQLRWNQFAKDGNTLIQSVAVDKEHRERLKKKWREEFEAVYPLL